VAQAKGDRDAAIALCRDLRSLGRQRLSGALLANLWLAKGDATAIRAVLARAPQLAAEVGDAYDEFLACTKERPDDRPKLALQLGLDELFHSAGWTAQAIEALEAARKIVPGSAAIAGRLAARYAKAERRDDELRLREQLVRDHPEDPAASQRLARAYLHRGHPERARDVCHALLKRTDDLDARLILAGLALRGGDYRTAASHCRTALLKQPRDDRPLFQLIDALLAAEKVGEAAEAIRERQGADPEFVLGPFGRALLAAHAGRLDEALAHCRRGVAGAPKEPRLRFLFGILLRRKNDLLGALEQFATARLLQRDHLPAHVFLARALSGVGRTLAAAEAYQAAAAMAPQLVEVHLELADVLSRLGRHDEVVARLKALAAGNPEQRSTIEARIAQEFLAAGDPTRALAALDAILLQEPAHPLARAVAARACRQLGDLQGAIRVYERSLGAERKAEVDAELGLLRLMRADYKEAAERLARAAGHAAQAPERAELHKWHAAACVALGLTKDARAAAEAALADRPDGAPVSAALAVVLAAVGADAGAQDELARLEKAMPEAARWLRAALGRLTGDRELTATMLSAHAASAYGWKQRAAELFRDALKKAPDEPVLLVAAAIASRDAGQFDLAAESSRQLASRCPRSGLPHFLLGSVLDAQRKPDAALEAYASALPLLDKQELSAWLLMAQRFAAAGKFDEAIRAYGVVLEAEPKNAEACNNVAWLYASHKPDKLAEAERLAGAAVEAAPQSASFRDTLGWIYFLRRNHAAARRELQEALAQAPEKPVYFYHIGMIDFALGRRDQARRALRLALALDPNLTDADTARATLKVLEPSE